MRKGQWELVVYISCQIFYGMNWNITLPETNMVPENGWLEYDRFLLGWSILQGQAVSFREGKALTLTSN